MGLARRAVSALLVTLCCAFAAGVQAGGYEADRNEPTVLAPAPPLAIAPAVEAAPPRVDKPDPAARLPAGKQGSEYWDLLARLDSGHFVFARFLLTNVGPGKHSAVVLGNVITPDGRRQAFRNGRRRSEWQLSGDRLKLDVNKCHLDLRNGTALLTVRKSAVKLALHFALEGGALPPEGLVPDRYAVETLAANASVRGTIALAGRPAVETTGTGAVTHTWTSEPEEERVWRRLDFFTLSPDLGLQLSEFRTPDGAVRRWLRATRDGGTVFETSSLELSPSGRLAGTPRGYPVEANLALSGDAASGDVALVQLLHQQDPLEAIPQPLRSVIRWSVSMEPHQLWTTASYDLSIRLTPGAAATPLKGEGLATIAFLNEQ
jgi:hypothetical protein